VRVGRGERFRQAGEQKVCAPARQQQPARAARQGEHRALHQQLAREAQAPGAERGAHRQLPAPGTRARQQKVGDVGARDEQHEADRGEERQEHRAHVLRDERLERLERGAQVCRGVADARPRQVLDLGARLLD
jgi:hypothetical protein